MVILVIAGIIAMCAVLVLFRPDLINVLSENDRKRMNVKKTGRVAFWGLMTTALVLVALWICGIRNELVNECQQTARLRHYTASTVRVRNDSRALRISYYSSLAATNRAARVNSSGKWVLR